MTDTARRFGRTVSVEVATGPSHASVTGTGRVDDAVGIAGRWLLLAVALDLVMTRIVVRLAIFVPKGDPWATASAVLGRVGAVADVLVVIAGIAALVVLLLRAGRGSIADRLLGLATAVIAAAGFALLVIPLTPEIAAVLDALIVGIALVAVTAWRPAPTVPRIAQLGLVALGVSVAAPAAARLLTGDLSTIGSWVVIAGQWAVPLGAVALGAAGLMGHAHRGIWRPAVLAGVVVAALLLAAAWRSPTYTNQLLIWSLGIAGAVPLPVLAVAAGLAIAGIPALARRAWRLAVGGTIVFLAGPGLVASGLVLASLVGLLVARLDHMPAEHAARRSSR